MSTELLMAVIGAVATIIGLAVAAYYGAMSMALKSGTRVRGTYHCVSSIECEDKYVTNVTLENLKDRAVVIFGISLQVGRSNYIVLEEFEAEPLILQPFQAIRRSYEPIDTYVVNGQRISFNKLLWAHSVKKHLVLETGDGKYVVKEPLRPWKPSHEAIKNDYTAVAHAQRTGYEGVIYGSNVKYLLHIDADTPDQIVVPLQRHEISYHRFRNFSLTPESLQSKETLQVFLKAQQEAGKFTPKSFFVIDLDAARARKHWFSSPAGSIDAPNLTWYEYHVEGRQATKRIYRDLREQNEKILRERTAKESPALRPSDPDGMVI